MIPVRDDNPHRSPPVATGALIGLNVVVFFVQMGIGAEGMEAFFREWAFVPGRRGGDGGIPWGHQILTMFTCMFLHGSFGHLLGNMWTLWIFGDNVEYRMGRVRYVVFYLLCGLAAGATHWALNASSLVPTVGASGAISGVMGAYVVMYPRANILMLLPLIFIPYFFRIPAWGYLGFWLVVQVVSGASMVGQGDVGGVAYAAHVGGFVAGVVLHWLFVRPRGKDRPPQPDEYGIEAAWGNPHARRRSRQWVG